MSLITRCPACETLFRVVPDQLRISDGWVRCGQCDEVFDASFHLLPPLAQENVPTGQQAGLTARNDVTDGLPDAAPLPADAFDADPDAGHLDHAEELLAAQEPILPDTPESDDSGSALPEPSESVISVLALPDPVGDAEPHDPDNPDSVESDLSAELEEVSFLRGSRVDSVWRKPLVRMTMAFLSLALLLGLAGQIVVHERDRIVASEPRLKPGLLALCGLLDCTLSPLRRIEFIMIESSSFARIRGDAYRLSFTVKNTAATPLAVPALELTLTDTFDQPVVRRIFTPAELGVRFDTLTQGMEWPVSIAVSAKAADGVDRVAGYRLLAFYP